MRCGDRRFFYNNPERLNHLMSLYEMGLSVAKIGQRFHKDHTSILYWVKKLQLKRTKNVRIKIIKRPYVYHYKRIIEIRKPNIPHVELVCEDINEGKNYEDYLKEKGLKLCNWSGIKYAINETKIQ